MCIMTLVHICAHTFKKSSKRIGEKDNGEVGLLGRSDNFFY